MSKTHLEQFIEMLNSIGYTPKIEEEENKKAITLSSNGENVHGYMGFVAHFEFKKDGSLDNVGIYE
jgi:di/tripeptidase